MAFASTVISVFILVALVEGVRRFGREYDRRLVRQARETDSTHGSLTKADGLYVSLYFIVLLVLDMRHDIPPENQERHPRPLALYSS